MYAVLVFECEYPCGNVYGIFDTEEDAINEGLKITLVNTKAAEDDVNKVKKFDDYCNIINVRVVEFEKNKIYKNSLTECSGCMSNTKYTGTSGMPCVTKTIDVYEHNDEDN